MEYGGRLMMQGKIPYRDFYVFAPPLHLIEAWLVQRLFGAELWIPRVAGIFQRLAIVIAVLAWLARQFPVRVAVPAVLAGTMVSESCVYMGFFSYFHTTFLYAVLMGLAAHLALEKPAGHPAWALLAGVCGGLSSLSKQTIGPFTTAVTCAVLGLVLWRRAGWRAALRSVACLSLGWWIPVGATLAWLAHHGALGAFLEQVFLVGPSSKGSLGSILVRPSIIMAKWMRDGILHPVYPDFYPKRTALVVLVALGLAASSRCRTLTDGGTAKIVRWLAVWVTLACLVAVAVANRVAFNYDIEPNNDLMFIHFYPRGAPTLAKMTICRMTFVSIFFCLLALAAALVRFWRTPARPEHASRVLLYSVCLALYYSASVSMGGQGCEPIGYTAVSATVAALLAADYLVAARLTRALVASLAVVACFGAACIKLDLPLTWIGWTEQPTNQAQYKSRQPLLRGLVLGAETVDCLDRIVGIVEQHTRPGDTIFAYPYMPIFYYLSDRHPVTFSYNHYFDVCADKFVHEDARRLVERPPAVLIITEFARASIAYHEEIFRGGSASGHNAMEAALAGLTREYRLVASLDGRSYTCGDWQHYPIQVWVRPEAVPPEPALP
jgi:hypothetical protein